MIVSFVYIGTPLGRLTARRPELAVEVTVTAVAVERIDTALMEAVVVERVGLGGAVFRRRLAVAVAAAVAVARLAVVVVLAAVAVVPVPRLGVLTERLG